MANRTALWELHSLGLAYGRRPSELLGVGDSWAAYQLDLAALRFGREIENRLQERDKEGRPMYRLESLLGVGERPAGFASLSSRRGVKKAAVPESGIW